MKTALILVVFATFSLGLLAQTSSPANLTAIAVSSTQINLAWEHPGGIMLENFRVYRKIGLGGIWSMIATVSRHSRSYNDGFLTQNTTYYYQVTAFYGIFESDPSNTASATTPYATPQAPSNLTATAVSTSQIVLVWQDNCNFEQGFQIERKIGLFGTWLLLATVGANVTAYNNFGLAESTTYYYRVRAYNGSSYSAYSNQANAQTGNPAPLAPTNLSISRAGNTVTLTWDAVPGAIAYRIYRSGDPQAVNWSLLAQAHGTSYSKSISSTRARSFYRVQSVYLSPVEMVYVPGGTFLMGNSRIDHQDDEIPTHNVTLSSFYIGKYELTQGQWAEIRDLFPDYGAGCGDDYPVYEHNWYSSIMYCNYRSMAEGLTPCYIVNGSTDPDEWGSVQFWGDIICDWNAEGYRLPTEAEWEYAARGATNNPDYLYAGSDVIGDVAWYWGNNNSQTRPVGIKAPNGIGTFDMSGNVKEWCWDWYSGSYYGSSPGNNPTGPASGSDRVHRGGGWFNVQWSCEVTERSASHPFTSTTQLGFRLCRSAP